MTVVLFLRVANAQYRTEFCALEDRFPSGANNLTVSLQLIGTKMISRSIYATDNRQHDQRL